MYAGNIIIKKCDLLAHVGCISWLPATCAQAPTVVLAAAASAQQLFFCVFNATSPHYLVLNFEILKSFDIFKGLYVGYTYVVGDNINQRFVASLLKRSTLGFWDQ